MCVGSAGPQVEDAAGALVHARPRGATVSWDAADVQAPGLAPSLGGAWTKALEFQAP